MIKQPIILVSAAALFQVSHAAGTSIADINLSLAQTTAVLSVMAAIVIFGHLIYSENRKKKFENEIKKSKEKYEKLFELSNEAVMLIEYENNRPGKIVEANRTSCELLGYTKQEMLALSLKDISILPEEKRSEHAEKILEKGRYTFESAMKKKSGETIEVQVSVALLELNGKKYALSNAKDVTEINRTVSELKSSIIREEKLNREKNEFISNISHEIRTPLNGIIGFTDILFEEVNDSKQKDMLRVIKKSGEMVTAIINDILDISKIEGGGIKLKRSEVNLKNILEDIQKLFEKEAGGKKIEFGYEYDAGDRNFKGDDVRIRQILLNVVGNAIKFTEKGSVKISIKEVETENGCNVYMDITDTGVGITKEKMKRLYVKFDQGEHFLTKRHWGTGLGLVLTKHLVNKMNGSINIESEEGKGTKVKINIPFEYFEKKAERDYSDMDEGIEGLVPKKILLAEDNEVNQSLIKIFLESVGWTVEVAENGREALNSFKRDKYDAILMDIQMPEMNGYDAAIEIRKLNTEIPIIALTAFAMEGDIQKAIEAGMNGHISKPFHKKDLITKIVNYF